MKKNGLKSILIVVFCACLCVGYFFYLTHKTGGQEAANNEAEMIISKDLENSYPKTAREVVKFYNRILKCYYSRGYTEEQLAQIAEQARTLMDEELKAQNPQDSYLLAVKEDISSFAKDGKEMYNTSVESSNEMEFKKVKGRECAYADVDYYIKSKKGSQRSSQTFILRRDADNKWRILGFYQ
ncbi:MAG: hypothetical protein HFH37_10140 [Lachnospiraceae bacterium]|jgi:hypothetical protein|nr:hypothetical protein [Lachnospiraceae bacterium]